MSTLGTPRGGANTEAPSTIKFNPRHLEGKQPLYQITFEPKLMERSNIIKMTHLSKEEILERLEEERFQRLKRAASNLKADMMSSSRCPLCTLTIPCKHFESQEQLYCQRGKLFRKNEWALLSQDNRNAIIRLKLDLQRKVREERHHQRDGSALRGAADESHLPPRTGSALTQSKEQSPPIDLEVNGEVEVPTFRPSESSKQVSAKPHHQSTRHVSTRQTSQYDRRTSNISPASRQTSMTSNATENFLLKIRINALKNKIGFRGLSTEQRAELEERIQQEYFNFHFDQEGAGQSRTALESQIELEELKEIQEEQLRTQMHPWHGKTKGQRKEYIEKLLVKFKTGQMEKEKTQDENQLQDFQTRQPGSRSPNKKAQRATRATTAEPKAKRAGTRQRKTKVVKETEYNTSGMGLQRWDVDQIIKRDE